MTRKRIAQGLSASWLRFFVTISLNLFQLPILNANFDRTILGVYLLFATFSMFLSLTDLGLGNVLSRAIAFVNAAIPGQERPNDDIHGYRDASIPDLIYSGFGAYALASMLLVVIGLPIGKVFFASVGLPPQALQQMQVAWLIFLAGTSVNLLGMAPFACLNGFGDIGWEPLIRMVSQIGRLAAIAVLAPLTHSVLALVTAEFFLNILVLLLGLCALARIRGIEPGGRLRWSLIQRMGSESLPLFVTRAGGLLILEATPVVVSLAMGPASVPDFVAMKQLTYLGIGIPSSIPTAISPFAAAAYSAGDKEKVLEYHSLTLRLTLGLAVLWLVGFLVWAPSITDLWLGKGHFLGYSVVVPLAAMALLEAHHGAHALFTWSTGRWPFAPWGVAGGILTIFFSILGGRYFGYFGIAVGSMVAQLLTNNWYVVYYTLTRLQIRLVLYVRSIILPAIGFGAVLIVAALLSAWVLESSWHAAWTIRGLDGTRTISLVGGGALTVSIAVILFWWLLLQEKERQFLQHELARRLRR